MSARLRIGLVLGEGQHAPGGIRSVCESLSHGLARLGLEPFWLVVERMAEVAASDEKAPTSLLG